MPNVGGIEFVEQGKGKPADVTTAAAPVETPPADPVAPAAEPQAEPVKTPDAPIAAAPKEWEILLKDETFKSLAQSYLSGDTDAVLGVMADQVSKLQEMKVDYKSMGADDIIVAKVRKEYPGLQGKALEKAVERYNAANFGAQPDEDADEGDLSLYLATRERHVQKLRGELLAEQEKLGTKKSIDSIKKEIEDHLNAQREEQEKAQKAWEAQLMGNQVIADAIKNGTINVGKSDKPVQFKLPDTDKFKRAVAEDAEFFEIFATGNKSEPVDLTKWARVVAFALDPDGYDAAVLAAGSSSGKEAIMEELINPARPNPVAPPSPSTLGEALLSAIKKK